LKGKIQKFLEVFKKRWEIQKKFKEKRGLLYAKSVKI